MRKTTDESDFDDEEESCPSSDEEKHESSLQLKNPQLLRYPFSEMKGEKNPNVRVFTFEEMRKATNDFEEARCIGEGVFGKVYRGVVLLQESGGDNLITQTQQKVAIKRALGKSSHHLHEFRTEIGMLSKLRHDHIIPLVGFCDEDSEMILVYDHVSRGSLFDHLYDSQKPPLPWKRRLQICIGVARALHCLHAQAATRVIIHRSVTPKDILLDHSWVAKLSDFGLSTMGSTQENHPISTNLEGDFEHTDPEYMRLGRLSEKSDVYSFGVVLLEVLCRRPVVIRALPKPQAHLVDWALHCHEIGMLDEIIDPHLKGKITPGCWKTFAETCAQCVAHRGIDRPAMGDVLPNLEWSLRLQEVEEHLYSKLPFMGIRSGATTENINLRGLFTLREMRKATNDFDQVLQVGFGEGGFSKVYRGAIDGGATHTAIKRARPETDDQIQKGWREFLKEVEMLSRLRHRHIVPLIGCCVGKSEMILVYDYMARGNLRQHLYESQKPPLTWKRRLQICIGVARSLHYLHAEATSHHVIIHRGVHTSNILLNYNWVAKLSDFGLSSMQDLVSSTEKSDVYSFGVVLLEVLCARPALDTTLPENQAELAEWALHCHKNGMVEECIDPHLKGKITPECLNMFVETAAKCLAKADNGMDPRAMGVVLRNLEFTLHLEENVEVPLWWWPSTIRPSQTELPKQSRESSWMPFSCRQFSLAETKLATRNFDEALCIGGGMFGKVYKGAIEGVGTVVAIKRADHQEQREFETVMTTLSMLCHRNLVSLVGYCNEDSRMILVYDYAGRGNLQQHLYWSGKPRLPWEQRLRICTEVARVLSYLHAGAAANYAIVHRNVKTTNILLNNEWVPKLSGFERPKRTSAHGHPDMKLDVYSFGVVLFEVLCTCPELDRGRSLPGRALHCLKNGTLEEIIDPHLKGQITSECLKLFVEVAQKCLVDQPAMGDVVRHLELALRLQLKESSNIEED